MNDLKICFNSFTEANEVHNDMLTLAQCNVTGAPLVSHFYGSVIYYAVISCPITALCAVSSCYFS